MVLLELHPPARLQIPPALVHELRPVLDTGSDSTAMDVVETVRVQPCVRNVIDQEFNIRRHQRGLNGAEVRASDSAVGMRFCELNRPCARTTADIKSGSDTAGDRREVQAPGQ